jgi:hypothetical protein
MTLDIEKLKAAVAKKGYKWFDNLNIVGIRTTMQVPDVFNDVLCVTWLQIAMPSSLTIANKQKWLNDNLFYGKDGQPLSLDGKVGANTQYALDEYNKWVGKHRMKSYTITTDPGTYYLEHPVTSLGSAVLKPGQYLNAWKLGYHKQSQDHPALVQIGNVTVYRDNDKDNVAEESKTTETGLFGINIHGANKNGITSSIGKWSAGCQVFCEWTKKEEFLKICKMYEKANGNKFTYTLLQEKDFS